MRVKPFRMSEHSKICRYCVKRASREQFRHRDFGTKSLMILGRQGSPDDKKTGLAPRNGFD